MASTTFTDNSTVILAEWLNEVNTLVHTIFGNPTYASQAVTIDGSGNFTFSNDLRVSGTLSGDMTLAMADTLDVSLGTLTLANNQISGNAIDGGTISNFASTGIDDNASATALTINSSGNVGIGIVPTSPLHISYSKPSNYVAVFNNTTATNPYGLFVYNNGASPDNNTQTFLECQDSTTLRLAIYSDGDVVNHDNTYGAISDIKLKQDIVDASSQWDDIKNLTIRKFRMISDVAADVNAPYKIGLVAQEAELVSPGLVAEHPDMDEDNNDLGTTTKSIKYSILYMKAIKALQEAQTRIETVETEKENLKALLVTEGLITQIQADALEGSISISGTTTSYNTTSDYHLKENIVPLTDSVDRVLELKPSRFNFKKCPDRTVDGFIAHEVQQIVPEAVIGEKDGKEMQQMDAAKLIPLLTASIQELVSRIEYLESTVNYV